MTLGRESKAIAIVVVCAALWGFWWLPVSLMERAGFQGPWIAFALNVVTLPVAAIAAWLGGWQMSGRAVLGALLIGLAVSLYAMAASYTDFIRAVILFYFAPAWSTLIEIIWFRRKWTRWVTLALSLSFTGILLISRGEISFDGLGAVGDWMALASGLSWSVGVALLFSGERANVTGAFLVTLLGGAGAALIVGLVDGSLAGGLPEIRLTETLEAAVVGVLYLGILLGGTLWGAFRLPPAVMTYLLSVEILGGVLSSAILLDERFGVFEIGGAVCILAAVFVEVLSRRDSAVRP
ncbi:MAG: DMT family transporter [Pseudomonadota bacterium]